MRPHQRKRAGTEVEHAFLVGIVIHPANEAERVGLVWLRGRREIGAVHAIREPVRGGARAIGLERLPLGTRSCSTQVESAGEPSLLAGKLSALEQVAYGNREWLVARVLQPLLRIHIPE